MMRVLLCSGLFGLFFNGALLASPDYFKCPNPWDGAGSSVEACYDVGCRPSGGECFNSCPDHRFIALDTTGACAGNEVRCLCRVSLEDPRPRPY